METGFEVLDFLTAAAGRGLGTSAHVGAAPITFPFSIVAFASQAIDSSKQTRVACIGFVTHAKSS